MIALRRVAIWMVVVLGVSVFALAPVLVRAQGTLPAGRYTTSSTLAGFNYFTPDFATGLSVFVQVETKVSDPRDGSQSSSHTESVYIEYFRDLGRLPVNEQGMLDPADVGRTMAKYATDVVR